MTNLSMMHFLTPIAAAPAKVATPVVSSVFSDNTIKTLLIIVVLAVLVFGGYKIYQELKEKD